MAFRSFTLNLSIILCKYFLKACATMTLISQFKSKFKTDCKAMSYVLACRLPHFISEHLRRQIKRRSPWAQPAVCQIFKYAGMQKNLSDFSTSKLATTPYFPISFWLTYILSHSLPQLGVGSCLLACSPLLPLCSNWIQCALPNGSQFRKNHRESFQVSVSLKWIWKRGWAGIYS